MIDDIWKNKVDGRLNSLEKSDKLITDQMRVNNETMGSIAGNIVTMSANIVSVATQLNMKVDKETGKVQHNGASRTSVFPAALKVIPRRWRLVAILALGGGGTATGIINWDALARLFGGG